MFADGSRAEEAEVREWCEPTSQPKIAGRNLFDPNVPVRWIIDRNQPPVPKPPMYVEFVGGDRLAGEVVGYSDGHETPYETQPSHLLVRPVSEVQPPDVVVPSDVRDDRLAGTSCLGADGFRGIPSRKSGCDREYHSRFERFDVSGVTPADRRRCQRILPGELGEVHLPKINPWRITINWRSFLPEAKSRVIQIQVSTQSVLRQSNDFSSSSGDRTRTVVSADSTGVGVLIRWLRY